MGTGADFICVMLQIYRSVNGPWYTVQKYVRRFQLHFFGMVFACHREDLPEFATSYVSITNTSSAKPHKKIPKNILARAMFILNEFK
jgi:hypothetical protein